MSCVTFLVQVNSKLAVPRTANATHRVATPIAILIPGLEDVSRHSPVRAPARFPISKNGAQKHHRKCDERTVAAYVFRSDSEQHNAQRPNDAHEQCPEPVHQVAMRDYLFPSLVFKHHGTCLVDIDQITAHKHGRQQGIVFRCGESPTLLADSAIGWPRTKLELTNTDRPNLKGLDDM